MAKKKYGFNPFQRYLSLPVNKENYIEMIPISDADAPINSVYLSSDNADALAFKDAIGTVYLIDLTPA